MPLQMLFSLLCLGAVALAQAPKREPREFLPAPFDRYLERRVREISSADWSGTVTRENHLALQTADRARLQRMLGLDPWPERTPLQPQITGTIEGDGYVVEKLHFQSRPGLYVTANFYRPKEVPQPLPAILYVCGHANVVEDGVSMGNKTGYHHHGVWFARHGYVCLIIDTIQLGEIRGEHHGTHSKGRLWWAARGYTPAGVEAWNGLRALDYLETRPEVDRSRFGLTGRSGGGAYSWWIAALDERIKAVVPVAGITTLKNHLLDGAIEGHCDCMFMVNTERWDFDRVAALVAPRPLLVSNTDSDGIFPLDGVMEIFNRTRALYRRLGKADQVGLHLAEGPHQDTQPLNTGAFHWLNRWLKNAGRMDLTDEPARKTLAPAALKVFATLPADEKVTTADEWFVPAFTATPPPATAEAWAPLRDGWMKALREDVFRAWPEAPAQVPMVKPAALVAHGLRLTTTRFTSEDPFSQPLWLLHRDDVAPEQLDLVVLNVLDDESWDEFRALRAAAFPAQFPDAKGDADALAEVRQMLAQRKWAMAYTAPRGIGDQSWRALSSTKQTHLRRRLLLLGESLESGQVWDIRQAAAALRQMPGLARVPLWLQAERTMAANTLYASLFIPELTRLDLHAMPTTHRDGPIYLNVLRHLDLPQAVALAAERATVALYSDQTAPWAYAQTTARQLQWGEKRVQLRTPLPAVGR